MSSITKSSTQSDLPLSHPPKPIVFVLLKYSGSVQQEPCPEAHDHSLGLSHSVSQLVSQADDMISMDMPGLVGLTSSQQQHPPLCMSPGMESAEAKKKRECKYFSYLTA